MIVQGAALGIAGDEQEATDDGRRLGKALGRIIWC